MKPTKLVSAILLAVCMLGVALPGCSKRSSRNTEQPREVHAVLALDWVPEPEFGGFYAARETGAFRKHGLDVEIRGGGSGVPIVQMVAAGRADFGVTSADEVIIARARGVDVVPVFATFQTSPQGIMVHAARGYRTLGDALKVGTLAVEPGLPYVAYLKKKYGGFGAAIVPYDGGVARFVVDPMFEQQCFITAEPIAARRQGSDPQVFMIADEGFNPYATVIIVKRSFFTGHAGTVRAFVDSAREGWATYLTNPASTNAVMQKLNPTMDAQTFAAAAAAEKPLIEGPDGARGLGSMTRERWETLATELVGLGIVEHAPPIDDYLPTVPAR